MKVLGPAKYAVEYLSMDSMNIIGAETVLTVCLDELAKLPYQLADQLYDAIHHKIQTRRNDVLCNLVLYLHNPDDYAKQTRFKKSSIPVLNSFAIKMIKRLFGEADASTAVGEEDNSDDADGVVEVESQGVQLTVRQHIANALRASALPNALANSALTYKQEMTNYAKTKQRTPLLDQLLDALKTVQATSVTPERYFSQANNVVTKNRTRLTDANVNAIMFLKCFFQNKIDVYTE